MDKDIRVVLVGFLVFVVIVIVGSNIAGITKEYHTERMADKGYSQCIQYEKSEAIKVWQKTCKDNK